MTEGVIFAEVPEHGELGNISKGTWVYYIEPEEDGTIAKDKIPAWVKAQLYRVDDAVTLEGQRMRLKKYKVLALGLVVAASIFLASTGLARAKDQSYAFFETVENHTNQAALTMRIPKEQDGNVQTLKIAVKAENIKGNLDSVGIEFSENIKKNVVWKSSNTKVAAVNQDGKVYAKKTGTATITCTSKENAKISASVKVTIVVR